MQALLAATSPRFAMFVLGLIVGGVVTISAFWVLMTLQDAKAGIRRRTNERRYTRSHTSRPVPTDPLIRRSLR